MLILHREVCVRLRDVQLEIIPLEDLLAIFQRPAVPPDTVHHEMEGAELVDEVVKKAQLLQRILVDDLEGAAESVHDGLVPLVYISLHEDELGVWVGGGHLLEEHGRDFNDGLFSQLRASDGEREIITYIILSKPLVKLGLAIWFPNAKILGLQGLLKHFHVVHTSVHDFGSMVRLVA